MITEIEQEIDKDEEKEGEGEKEEPSIKKMPTYTSKLTKKSKTAQFSMNSIDISKVTDEDMLTYVKMKKLKNLFNVCKIGYFVISSLL
jgi:hypothetical protein